MGNKMLKKIIILFLISVFTLTGCFHWSGVRGSGDIEEEIRDIEEFDELDISGAFTVRVAVGESPYLQISGDDNLLKYVRTRVRGDRLIIDTKREINARKKMKINVSTSYLEKLNVSGANSVKIRGIDSDKFRADISGACTVSLEGETGVFDVDLSGATKLYADDFRADQVKIDCSGASKAEVFAREYLNADASGVSKIYYRGNPEDIRSDASGISSIRRR
jgi:predicted small secreted protein